jgi:hypothetical protein
MTSSWAGSGNYARLSGHKQPFTGSFEEMMQAQEIVDEYVQKKKPFQHHFSLL